MTIKQLFTRRKIYDDLSEEIRQHLDEKIDALVAEGMSREEAVHAARREFGNVTRIEERGRETWMWPLIERLWADTRFAFRQLNKNWGFAFTAIVTLALGIGATTAIFSLVEAVLLSPLPFPDSNRLVWISQQDHSLPGVASESLSYPDYFDWRAQNHTLSGIASYVGSGVNYQNENGSQRIDAQTVSSNFFDVLGVAPVAGRDFAWSDEKAGNRAVMLSYAFWQSDFGAAKYIVGKTIHLDGHNYTVAGVMPRDFRYPLDNPAPALWKSLAEDAEGDDPPVGQRGFDVLDVIGRLKPGVTVDQAKADMSLIAGNLAKQFPADNKHYSSALVEPELEHMTGDTRPAMRMMFAAVMLVLLLVCANVAGLLLARGSRRSAEFALRAAVGAGRAAIVRQLLVESLVLSLCGGAAGVALAFGLLRAILKFMPLDIPRIEGATLDARVLLFVLAVSLVSGILFGALPALRTSRQAPLTALREGSRTVAGGRGQHRIHNGLVVAQTAIGMVLLIGSGLLMRSFIRILNVDPGFDSKHVLTSRIGVSFDTLKHDEHFLFYQQLLDRIRALPGVESASAGWPMPMSSSNATISIDIEGRPVAKGDEPSESIGLAMPGYFETMRIPLIAGRYLGAQDGLAGPATVVINQAFAKKYFPGANPIGQHIQIGMGDGKFEHPMREVVGVIGDVKHKGLTADADAQMYVPYAQAIITNPYLVVRTNANPAAMQSAVNAAIHSLDKNVPVYQVRTLDDYLSKSVAEPRFQAFLLTCFAGIALVLAAIGLYGLLSYMVSQRTLEIGVRMALGAQRGDVLGMIVRRGLTLSLAGVGAGVAISVLAMRLISGMLFHTRPTDPVTFAATAALLVLVSVAASMLPAFRAARLDPMKTLREQ
jgi:putative ABC transport system permease protein